MRTQTKFVVRVHRHGVWSLVRRGHVGSEDRPPDRVADVFMGHETEGMRELGKLVSVLEVEVLEVDCSMLVQEGLNVSCLGEVLDFGCDFFK